MKHVRACLMLLSLFILSGCAMQLTQEEYETCIWGTSIAGAAAGSVGGVAGAAGGTAAGAIVGAFLCGPVSDEPEQMMAAEPVDSDGDGVMDPDDRCPGTNPGVPVNALGCPLDSDNDGVHDGLDQCPDTPAGVVVDGTGCPEKGTRLFVIDNINFAFDSSQIGGNAEATLEQAVQLLRENPGVRVTIEGHTDGTGSNDYNMKLSQRRASAVRNHLISRGIDGSRLIMVGRGEDYPIASNDTDYGRSKNRRVEFIVQ